MPSSMLRTINFVANYSDPNTYNVESIRLKSATEETGPYALESPDHQIPTVPEGTGLVDFTFDFDVTLVLDGLPHDFWFKCCAVDSVGEESELSEAVLVTLTDTFPAPTLTFTVA